VLPKKKKKTQKIGSQIKEINYFLKMRGERLR
jgi:hypothetical protein